MTLPRPVTALVTARRLERVPADRPSALARLTRAEEKPEAARKVAAIDVEVATVIASPSAREFQRMRRRRNKAEYDDIAIGHADLAADLAHAETIVEFVRSALRQP